LNVNSAGNFLDNTFAVADNTTPSKKFALAVQGNADSVTTTLAMSSSVARTLTLPNATTTLAGLAVSAQTWTGTHLFTGGSSGATMEISPTNDITSLIIRASDLSVLNDIFAVYDGGANKVVRVGNNSPVFNAQSIALWTSGVDAGFSMTFGVSTITANRTATFPDATGTVVLTQTLNLNNRTTDIGVSPLVPIINAGVSPGNYIINWYAVVETAAGSGPSSVALAVTYTDAGGVARTEAVGSIDTTTLNNKSTATTLINTDGSVDANYSLVFTTASGTPAIDSYLSVTRI